MPGKLDLPLTAVAERLIQDFGKEVSYTNKVSIPPTDQDIIEGSLEGSVSATSYEIIISPPFPYKESLINGETIRQGDANVLIKGQGLPFIPNITDEILIDNIEYEVLDIDKLYSGRLVAAYQLQIRAFKGV